MWPSLQPGAPEDQYCHLRAFSNLRSYLFGSYRQDRIPRNFPIVTNTVFLSVVSTTKDHAQHRSLNEVGFIVTSNPTSAVEISRFKGCVLKPDIVDFDILKG